MENIVFNQLITIIRFEFLKNLRRKRFSALLIVTLLIIILPHIITATFNIPYPEDAKIFAQNSLNMIETILILSVSMFAGDIISSEFDKRTGYVLMVNPVRREIILLGKFLSAALSTMIILMIPYVSCIVGLVIIYGEIVNEIFLSLAYAIIYMVSLVGLAILFSSLIKNSTLSIILTFLTLFLAMPILSTAMVLTGQEPWFILTYCSGIILQVFNPPKERVVEIKAGNTTFYRFYPDIATSIMVMIGYTIITVLLALIILKTKELKD